jgi:hypothetical protein
MKTSQQIQKISTGLSLMVLAIGFTLMGLVSILHRPLSADALEVGSTMFTLMGGCAGMAAGSIFSFAALVYWRQAFDRTRLALDRAQLVSR